MKRFVCFLLTLVMIVGLLPATLLTASAASVLETSDKAIEILKQFEGFREKPYKDGDKWYIGYGTLVDNPNIYNDGITKTEATQLLKDHIHPDNDSSTTTVDERINKFAKTWNIAFTQHQHDALALFSYNCGTKWMDTDGAFRSAVINGKRGNDFLNAICLWNGSNVQSDYFGGLMNRRLAEANMYLNNSYSSKAPDSYTYVILNLDGGTLKDSYNNNLVAYAYVATSGPALNLKPTKSGATFLGWYDDKGVPVTTLDKTTGKTTVYASWQESDAAVSVKYSINSSEAASLNVYRKFDGKTLVGTLKANSKFDVVREYVDGNNVKWVYGTGKDSKNKAITGWVGLKDMDDENLDTEQVLATGTVTATELTVREASTTESGSLGSLPKGTIVKILAYKNEYTISGTRSWGKIMYNGSVGWISLAYVNLKDASAEDNTSIAGKTGKIANVPAGYPGAKVRAGAGVGNAEVATLKEGTTVTVYETKVVGAGANSATWGRIKWDGVKEGWIYMYYVSLDGSISGTGTVGGTAGGDVAQYTGIVTSNTNLNIRQKPDVYSTHLGSLPRGTKINIYEKTTTNGVEWGRSDKGWVCLLYVSLTATGNNTGSGTGGDANHVLKKDVGTVTASSLIIRKTATNNSENLGSLEKGDRVTILEQVNETTTTGSKLWGKVTVGDITGWINLAYVDIDQVTDYIPDNENTGSGNGTGIPGVISDCTNVNVRAEAGVNNALVTTLPAGRAVTVYQQKEVNNAPWGKIDQGWVCMYYVTLSDTSAGGSNSGSTDPNGYVNGTTAGVISATGIVNSNIDLNVRSGAGLGYAKVSSLKRGTQVTIYEQKIADGMTWGKINSGWVCMSYITINSSTNSGKGVMGTVARCFSHVNVRSAPGTGNALVGTIQVGARVEVYEQRLYSGQYWGRVAQGWVCMEYILLDEELPPTDPNAPTEGEDKPDTETTPDSGTANTNPSVSFAFTGTVNAPEGLNVRKDATSKSGLAGTLNNGTAVNIVALKQNRTENNDLELWGKTTEYGTPGWINLAYLNYSIDGYIQSNNVTVYSIPSTGGEDLAIINVNAPVSIVQVALDGSTVWGKIDLDAVDDKYLAQQIGGLVGWIPMSKFGTEDVFTIPTHNKTATGGAFVGRTYGLVNAYKDFTAEETLFKLEAGAAVSVFKIESDHGTVWGKVKAKDYYGQEVEAWIDVSKVMFAISCNVVASEGLNVRSVPFGNDESTILGQVNDGTTLVITALMMSDNGEYWGQIQTTDGLNGGWVNMTYTNAPKPLQ